MPQPSRVLLLLPTTTYKAADFLEAATRLSVEVVVGTDGSQAFESVVPGRTLTIGRDLARGLAKIRELARTHPLQAVIGTDDETTVLAAEAARELGLPHNPIEAVRATRNKFALRQAMADAGLQTPWFFEAGIEEPPEQVARKVRYPCVLKPLSLSASRGVLRADDETAFVMAFERVAALLTTLKQDRLLIEGYLPGVEVAVDGLLSAGRLRPLVLFDKPDPLEGPTFEETIYVTPSRQPAVIQQHVFEEVARGCAALGLREGPVHAELRIDDSEPSLLELAPRTIGGLCARTLRFGAGLSLEELVLRHALGRQVDDCNLQRSAAGVMMIPIPSAGTLGSVRGIDRARRIPQVTEVTITMHRGAALIPLPEGHRYLGFIFARAAEPDLVEQALRLAHAELAFEIEPPTT